MQGKTLYIGNLSDSTSKEQLHELFSGYGSVIEVKIIGNNAFAFVEMSSQAEAENARNSLNGYSLNYTQLKVNEAFFKNEKRNRNHRR
ncbi:MAG: RNA-binding protein [Spirochaetes bacterium]|nr:RNA-binding protein [Spirochaetota bacterium]